MTFNSLNIIDPILKAIAEEGYITPTPIQVKSIPLVLEGKDIIGCAQTGTGKTAAFAVPILQLLSRNISHGAGKKFPRALIVTPTRELAIQIGESFHAYGRYTPIKHAVIYGGVNQGSQVSALNQGVDLIIATSGRLLDLLNQGYIQLDKIEIFVLDEADRMLDMGFIHDIKKILNIIPKKRQSLFFSATMPDQIIKLAEKILHNPLDVSVSPVSSTVEIISQKVIHVKKIDKVKLLLHVLNEKEIKNALVFTRTKYGADKLVRHLIKNNISAAAIHGDKAQNARQKALNSFKQQRTRILVATDIASRGIDVDNLEYVINFEIPNMPETYVHRIGRTGRAGAQGTAISFCDTEEKLYLRDIEKLISRKIDIDTVEEFSELISLSETPDNTNEKPGLVIKNKERKTELAESVTGTEIQEVVKSRNNSGSKNKRRWYHNRGRN